MIGTASAAIITVYYVGNGDYKMIDETIGTVSGGDTILASSGMHNEKIWEI